MDCSYIVGGTFGSSFVRLRKGMHSFSVQKTNMRQIKYNIYALSYAVQGRHIPGIFIDNMKGLYDLHGLSIMLPDESRMIWTIYVRTFLSCVGSVPHKTS